MAIVQMQRINICALKKNRKAILERLQELGAMEVDIRLEDEELCEKQDVSSSRSTFERRSQTADQALHILDEYAPEKKGMLDSLAGKPLIDKESLAKAAAQQDNFMQTATKIIMLDKQVAESQAWPDSSGKLLRNEKYSISDRYITRTAGSAECAEDSCRRSTGDRGSKCRTDIQR